MSTVLAAPAQAFAATLAQDGRPGNEDAFLIRPGPPLLVALADGAGQAEQAARWVLRQLEQRVAGAAPEELERFATWSGWLRSLDAALAGGPQSTLVALVVLENRILGAAAGDSRAYLHDREGELHLLTEGADRQRLGSGAATPHPIHRPFARGETLVLLSDGAWTPLSMTRLRDTLAHAALGPLAELPETLLHAAARTGRADDMTAVAVRRA